MRTLIQRVRHASVTIDGTVKSKIGTGLLVLVGIEDRDTHDDVEWLAKKIANLRVFDDDQGVMNRSVTEIGGEEVNRDLVHSSRLDEEGQSSLLHPRLETRFRHPNV